MPKTYVITTKPSKIDLASIYNYISRNSIFYASKTVNEILLKIYSLENSILLHRKVPELNQENTREMIYKSYRIIYQIKGKVIYIRRIIHGARNFLTDYFN